MMEIPTQSENDCKLIFMVKSYLYISETLLYISDLFAMCPCPISDYKSGNSKAAHNLKSSKSNNECELFTIRDVTTAHYKSVNTLKRAIFTHNFT